MSASTYIIWAADTSAATAPPTFVATSATANTVKTILQWKPTVDARIIEWGYTFDALPAAPVKCELLETGTVNATVTTIGSGIRLFGNANGTASSSNAGTTGTGFNSSNEGSISASRLLDYQWENGLYFKKQFPLGREPEIKANNICRVRFTPSTSVAVNVMPYLVIEE